MADRILDELGLRACAADPRHALAPCVFHAGGIAIHVCPDCGTFVTDRAFVPGYYDNENAYSVNLRTLSEIEEEWGFRWRRILSRIGRLAPGPRILDVGAGNGYFVKLARDEFGSSVTGVEMSRPAVELARDVVGVDLIHGDVTAAQGQYDAVTLFNVIEHVDDPGAFLCSLVERLRPGGLLVLTTPSPSCVHARVKGVESWSMLHHPEHLNIFTRAGLDALVRRCELTPAAYETMSTYIRSVRRFDTAGGLLRRAVFHALRMTGLGADHCLYARRT